MSSLGVEFPKQIWKLKATILIIDISDHLLSSDNRNAHYKFIQKLIIDAEKAWEDQDTIGMIVLFEQMRLLSDPASQYNRPPYMGENFEAGNDKNR